MNSPGHTLTVYNDSGSFIGAKKFVRLNIATMSISLASANDKAIAVLMQDTEYGENGLIANGGFVEIYAGDSISDQDRIKVGSDGKGIPDSTGDYTIGIAYGDANVNEVFTIKLI